mmetsp:Transcript_4087/g.10303  ORF Transcript_4087/g.10303 Transcript_4087/m.10303 type:complete len:208 (-) Transcript_4087:161-784(-)
MALVFGGMSASVPAALVVVAAIAVGAMATAPPLPSDTACTARWMAHSATYGALATTSRNTGQAFSNIASYADGTADNATGQFYFFVSPLDASVQDVAVNPNVSFALSEMTTFQLCQNRSLDPEDPRCGRLTISGKMISINSTAEGWGGPAEAALFSRHPVMRGWVGGGDHNFGFFKIAIEQLWLIDFFGGAAIIEPDDYFAARCKYT